MNNENYEVAIVQTREIIRYFDKDLLSKIPKKLIEKLNNFKSEKIFEIDKSKTLEEQNISKETKELVSSIFIQYCCDEEKRNEILKKCAENDAIAETKLQEKYSVDNLFKAKETNKVENVALMEVNENKNWFIKLVERIKKIFKRS